MFNWIMRFFGLVPEPPRGEVSEANSKEFLNRLREDELSLGAALRRGDRVGAAPGQTSGARPVPAAARAPAQRRESNTRETVEDAGKEDFALSMAVGMATGSAAMGYVVGGSLTGGVVGAATAMDEQSDSNSASE